MATKKVTPAQQQYLETAAKLAHIKIVPGLYSMEGAPHKYEIISVNEEDNSVQVRTIREGSEPIQKTLYWARKKLQPV